MKSNFLSSVLLISAILCLSAVSCSKTTDQNLPSDPVAIPLTTEQVSLISSENTFAFDLFREVLAGSKDTDNIIISPFSISTALSMTVNGAAGNTKDAILAALRAGSLSSDAINTGYGDLSPALLEADQRVKMTIANSMWTEKNFSIKEPFKKSLTSYYKAEAKPFDGSDPLAYKQINSWIEDKTNGLIKNMLNGLDDNTAMLLMNAIYFKAKWKYQFETANTSQETFYLADGNTTQVPMMKQTRNYNIYQGNGFILAEFPYGQGNYVMDVLVPSERGGISELSPVLTTSGFNNAIGKMSVKKTNLYLPRFKFSYKTGLKDILTNMGMGIAFTDSADFTSISDTGLKIKDVIHQAFIETKEDGTEAAAATVVVFVNTSVNTDEVNLRLDHPFAYIIRETSTNSILFMGIVMNPSE